MARSSDEAGLRSHEGALIAEREGARRGGERRGRAQHRAAGQVGEGQRREARRAVDERQRQRAAQRQVDDVAADVDAGAEHGRLGDGHVDAAELAAGDHDQQAIAVERQATRLTGQRQLGHLGGREALDGERGVGLEAGVGGGHAGRASKAGSAVKKPSAEMAPAVGGSTA
ncbi:MAG: hypothetical protein U1F43_06485 [Myxococcota bacterium]